MPQGHVAATYSNDKTSRSVHSRGHVAGTKSQCVHTQEIVTGDIPFMCAHVLVPLELQQTFGGNFVPAIYVTQSSPC